MYDVMARERRGLRGRREVSDEDWSPDRHRIVDGDEVRDLLPALARRDPSGAYLFYDCQTDDVRLVLTVLGEAERFGAVVANRCEVLELVEQGLTNEQIARRLVISTKTVDHHVSAVLAKLGVSSRREAALAAGGALAK